jgi:WD40 repeat protein
MTAQTDDFQEELHFIVTALSWSPNSSKMAVGSAQYTESGAYQNVRLDIIDSTTNQVIRTLHIDPEEYAFDVRHLLLSPTGETLFANFVNEVRCYDVNTGSLLRTYEHTGYFIRSIAINPAGTQTASVSFDNWVDVRDTLTGQAISSIDLSAEDNQGLLWVDWNLDGTKLATIGRSGIVRIWDATTYGQIQQFTTSVFPFPGIGAWSLDGTKLAVAGDDGFIRIWDVTSGNLLQTLTGEWSHPTWNPISNQLISQEGNRIKIWDMTNATLIQQIDFPQDDIDVSAVASSRDGRLAYGGDHLIEDFDINLLPQIEQIALPSHVHRA